VATFDEIFKIQPGNTLKLVHSHLGNYDDDWEHEERNGRGELVARYESWDHFQPRGPHSSTGWRKYAPDGTLIEKHVELPL